MEESRAARIEAATRRLGELEDELTAARSELLLARINVDQVERDSRTANENQRWKQYQSELHKEHLRGTTAAISANLYRHLDFISHHLNHIHDIEQIMADENGDVKQPYIWYTELITDVAKLIRILTNLSITLTVQGVHSNAISRKGAADRLGVHQATVARWVKGELPDTYQDDPVVKRES